jgi:hypothetical protein
MQATTVTERFQTIYLPSLRQFVQAQMQSLQTQITLHEQAAAVTGRIQSQHAAVFAP